MCITDQPIDHMAMSFGACFGARSRGTEQVLTSLSEYISFTHLTIGSLRTVTFLESIFG